MSRRRSRTSSVITIYWRDIPAQVTANHEGETYKALLHDRFQHAIDRAATVAGLTTTHEYVAEWRQERTALDGEPEATITDLAAELDRSYDRPRLEALVANGGLNPDDSPIR